MIPVFLTQIKARDGIVLDGIVVPPKKKGAYALIWLHGLTSRFSSGQDLIRELSRRTHNSGIGYFKFNTRGHDIVVRGPQKKLIGTAFERFEDSPKDIDAMIRYARTLGYKKIILAGHSTGANKVLYYQYKRKNPAVKGIILAGAMSDIYEWKRRGRGFMTRAIAMAKKLAKKNPQTLMPEKYGVKTAARYLSLYEPGHAEDVFPYMSPKQSWKELKSVRVPIAIILGVKDEYLDRTPKALIRVFAENAKNTKSFSGVVIQGANHGFQKKEKELASKIITWVHRNVR